MKTIRKVMIFAFALIVLLMSLPLIASAETPKAPINAEYERTSTSGGAAEGKITVTLPEDHNATSVCIWWANESGPLSGYDEIGNIAVESNAVTQVEYLFRAHTIIPPEATKLMIVCKNNTGDSAAVTVDLPESAAYHVDDGGKLVTEFHIISDPHVGRTDTDTTGRFKNVLTTISQKFPNSKAIFNVGDVVDRGGYANMWATFWNTYDSIENLPFMYIAVGNHEGYDMAGPGEERAMFLRNLRLPEGYEKPDEVYYDVWVDGLHIIVLGDTQKGSLKATIGTMQYDWLEQKLKESEKDEPVFILFHQGISIFQGELQLADPDRLNAILQDNPNVLLFYGHTHNDMLSSVGGLMNGGGIGESAVFDTSTAGRTATRSQGYYIEVYENRILVRGYNFLTSRWIPNAQYVLLEKHTSIKNTTPVAPASQDTDTTITTTTTVTQSTADPVMENNTAEQTTAKVTDDTPSKGGCRSVISTGASSAMLLFTVAFSFVIFKKRKKKTISK